MSPLTVLALISIALLIARKKYMLDAQQVRSKIYMETAKLKMHATKNVTEDLERSKLVWAYASVIMHRVWKTFAMMLAVLNPRRFPSLLMVRFKFTIPSLKRPKL